MSAKAAKPPQHITVAFGPGPRDAIVMSLCADRKWMNEVYVYRLVTPKPKKAKARR